jgi:hypothetical protein
VLNRLDYPGLDDANLTFNNLTDSEYLEEVLGAQHMGLRVSIHEVINITLIWDPLETTESSVKAFARSNFKF